MSTTVDRFPAASFSSTSGDEFSTATTSFSTASRRLLGGIQRQHRRLAVIGGSSGDPTDASSGGLFLHRRTFSSDLRRDGSASFLGGGSDLPQRRIFCNRSLNMRSIVAIGFDMDYTLAQYMPETFESLAYGGTTRKLVNDLGYPKEILGWTFDWKYMVRGLVLDKKRGNILKMDRHKYVKVAHHGFKELSKEEKNATYGNKLIRDAFDEPEYALIDTLFSLAEAYLFAQLVDFRDNHPGKFSSDVDYGQMYRDVRAAVDLCHRDGTLKEMVAKSPEKNPDSSF